MTDPKQNAPQQQTQPTQDVAQQKPTQQQQPKQPEAKSQPTSKPTQQHAPQQQKPATAAAATKPTPQQAPPQQPDLGLTLPTKKTPQRTSWLQTPVLIYGKEKIGKSTFAAQAPNAVFLPTEPGTNYLDVYKIPEEPGKFLLTWDQFLAACNILLRKDKDGKHGHSFQTIVIDTVDGLYAMCAKHVAKSKGIENVGDLEFGKGFDLVKQAFTETIRTIVNRGFGIIFISHVVDSKETIHAGSSKQQVTTRAPSIPNTGRRIVSALCDMILYFDMDIKVDNGKPVIRRVIRTKPSPNWIAGDRSNFLPPTIDMSYDAVDKAYRQGLESRSKNQPPPWVSSGAQETATPNIESPTEDRPPEQVDPESEPTVTEDDAFKV